MQKMIHPYHPDVNDDQWEKVDAVIEEGRDVPGALIAVLRKSQEIVGYLPKELLGYIAEGLNLPSSQVFGVATFYSYFSLSPKGRNIIKACTGTACYVKGIKEALSRIYNEYGIQTGETTEDRRFTLEGVRCLGACGLAPAMVVNDDVHGAVTPDSVINILEKYE